MLKNDGTNNFYNLTVTTVGDTAVAVLSKVCSVTGRLVTLTVDLTKYDKWKTQGYAAKIFPDLSKEQLIFLEQGLTPDEKKAI